MTTKKKTRGVRQDIVARKKTSVDDGRLRVTVLRELECGHVQAEPSGGKAALATYAFCTVCPTPQARGLVL